MLRRLLALSCSTALLSSAVQAATPSNADIQDALNKIQTDSTLVSGWTSNQLKYAIPFNSTSGNVVPRQLKLFGFEVGAGVVASSTKLDVPGLRALPTNVVNPNSIDISSRLPMPSVIAQAKIGLPFGLDAGVRGGGIPAKSFDSGSTHVDVKNSIFGIDLRKKIIDEGMLKPFGLTLGLNYTHAKGHLDTTTDYNSNSQVTVNGNTYNSALSAYGSDTGSASAKTHTAWDTNSWGLQAILNKKIVFINPYVGASINRNAGTPSTAITTSGRETLSDNSNNSASQDFITTGGASAAVNKWDVRALAGLEITPFPFLNIDLGGEYAGTKDLAASVGLRVQFR
jgi:hypothetical protein